MKGGAPPRGQIVARGGEAVRESASQPESVEVGCRFERVDSGQLPVGDPPRQRFRRLSQQLAGRRSQQQKVAVRPPLPATRIDPAAQDPEEPGHPLNLVQNDQPVMVQIEICARVVQPGPVGRILWIEVDRLRKPTGDFAGQGRLPHLSRAEEDNGRKSGEVAQDG